MRLTRTGILTLFLGLVILAITVFSPTHRAAAASTLVVPNQYSTVQAAVNAASPGDTIKIKPGTYTEQVSIGKDLTIKGAGALLTTIKAPPVLVLDSFGRTAIIKIDSGATVNMTGLTVSGPAATACADGTLNTGIWIIADSTLNLSFARVTHIHDTPRQFCNRAGTAVTVGGFISEQIGHATIDHVVISDYQGNGVSAFTPGSALTVTNSIIDAQTTAADFGVFTGGIEIGAGAVAKVTHNIISNSRCVGTNDLGPCGSDPMSNFQASGITNGPGDPPGPGTEFAYNVISGNDVGIYLGAADDCCLMHHNLILNSVLFGIVFQDSINTTSHDVIVGGPVGVAVVADALDSVGTFEKEAIFRQSIAQTQELECCGFNATVVRTP
jgi:hypothetical protein